MKTSPNRTASSSSLYFALTSRDCNKGVLSIHVFGPEVRSCFSFALFLLTGVTWQDAGKVRLFFLSLPEKSLNFAFLLSALPFPISTLIRIEVLVIGYIEFRHNLELDSEKRLYPSMEFRSISNVIERCSKKKKERN
ncbi:unnamed protein product [Brassica oleracea var. botrytis]|uniref:(rape) hypothetical protein n=1 Tax=Brassica napus TaxID=3708 RepID=A0A816IPK7_BRANA|nr:unnamed protein product [Brassica napus]